MTRGEHVKVRALRTRQGAGVDVYSFFMRGDQVAEIADITRLRRTEGQLDGFQRREIKSVPFSRPSATPAPTVPNPIIPTPTSFMRELL